MSDRDKAEYYFKKQKKYPQGSIQEQEYLDKSINADPLYVPALVEKSVSFNKRSLYSVGFKYLNMGVEFRPIENLGYRGFIKLYMLRDYEGALHDFLRLDSLTPTFRDYPWGEDIYKVVGLCYLQLEDFDRASDFLEKSIKYTNSGFVEDRTYLYAGITELKKQNYRLSMKYFDSLLNYNKKSSEAYFYKSEALFKLEDIENAFKCRDSALFYFDKGYKETSPYFEVPYQIYRSDIIKKINGK